MAIRVVIFPTLLLLVACFMPPSSMRQKYTTVFSSSGSIDDSVERNRAIISALVKHCWQRVTKLLPPSQSLAATSEELKATTVMLVMASIRESESRAIFAAADRNGDGSLTFSEWLDWLGNGDDSFKLGFLGGKSSTSIYDSSAEDVDSSITASLGIVLSHAVAALKVIARVGSSSAEICAAYVAGGILSGGITAESSTRMLTCLSPTTRELVLRALAIEAASLGNQRLDRLLSSSSKSTVENNNDDRDANMNVNVNEFSIQLSSSKMSTQFSTTKNLNKNNGKAVIIVNPKDEITSSIEEDDGLQISKQFANNFYRASKEVEEIRASLEDIDDPSAAKLRLALISSSQNQKDVLAVAMSLRAARVQHASSAVLGNLGLPGSPRDASCSLSLPSHLKHRLALDTLQLWAPISFQLGLGYNIPELEVYSYVLLFPRSFGNFLSWYADFRPVAKNMLSTVMLSLKTRLEDDPVLRELAVNVVLQSRVKTAPSAFKKMVKGAKAETQLYDLLGLRIIVCERFNYPLNGRPAVVTIQVAEDEDQVMESLRNAPIESYPPDMIAEFKAEHEKRVVFRILDILGTLSGWTENIERRKDYVSFPKKSGYQSIHTSLVNTYTNVALEVQIRTNRMHWVAEYGSAAHTNYKALLLPASITVTTTTNDEIDNIQT